MAGRTPEAIDREGERAAEAALRKRAVLGPSDPFVVEGCGRLRGAESASRADGEAEPRGDNEPGTPSDDALTWPWRTLTFHVPLERLPAIAGLTTDAVRGEG